MHDLSNFPFFNVWKPQISHHNAQENRSWLLFSRISYPHFRQKLSRTPFSVIQVNLSEFWATGSWGVRLLEIKSVIFARGVRLLESVRLLERIRYTLFVKICVFSNPLYFLHAYNNVHCCLSVLSRPYTWYVYLY